MSYRCAGFGVAEPHFTCDGCGVKKSCYTRHGMPAAWMLKSGKVPGWLHTLDRSASSRDYCKECRKKVKP